MTERSFNYSKWDNIELSDDESDLHPNIDKVRVRVRRAAAGAALLATDHTVQDCIILYKIASYCTRLHHTVQDLRTSYRHLQTYIIQYNGS
jgi:hypothetical protein